MDRSDPRQVTERDESWPPAPFSSGADGAGAPEPPGLSLQSVLHLIEEQGQIGFWLHELATGKITVSPGLARISGVPLTVTRTRESMLRCIHPQDRPFQEDQFGLVNTGQPLCREFRVVRPDGTIRWVSSRVEVALGDDGRPLRFIGVVVDITDRREAQRAVEYNHARRAALLEATSALTWTADPSGQIVDHTGWCDLTGMSPETCEDEGWLDAVHPDDLDRVRAACRSALTRNSVWTVDCRILTSDGAYRRYNAHSAPVRDASGGILEWQGVLLPVGSDHRPVVGEAGDDAVSLTGAQIRSARGLLDWSLAQLASVSGVSVSTIKRMEDGSEGTTRASKAEAVRRALQRGGIRLRVIDGTTWIGR